MKRLATILAGLALAFSGLASAAEAPPVTVFAAQSLQDALPKVADAYAKAGGGPVRFSFAGSQALAHQIDQGAPADVFVSADVQWMDWVAERKAIVGASRRDLLSNRLVLIAPKAARTVIAIRPRMPLAAALGSGRLAVGDTAGVPAGIYAKQALTELGVWDQVSAKLAPSDNVRGALAFVSRGEAPLGIVYATDAKAEPGVKVVGVFPEASHPKILYPAALVASSRNPAAARFFGFLQGPEAAAIFRGYGFTVLARPN